MTRIRATLGAAWSATLAVAGVGLMAGAAHAATQTFDWTYVGADGTDGSGSFVESNGVLSSITGTFGGETITALLPVNSLNGNDNEYPLTVYGIGFSLANAYQGGSNINISNFGDVWMNNKGIGDYGTFTATAVPEPATVSLIGVGVAGLLGARRRRRAAELAA